MKRRKPVILTTAPLLDTFLPGWATGVSGGFVQFEDVTGLQLVHTGNVQVVIAVSCKGFGGDVKEGVWLGGGGLGSSVQLQHAVVVQVLQHAGRA